MTHRERMLAVLEGRPVDRVPWAPRMDLWYRMREQAGSLPEPFLSEGLYGGLRTLGWARHAIIPDFRELRSPDDDAHRALGIYNLPCMPFRTDFAGVSWRVIRDGERTWTHYDTPRGPLRTCTLFDDRMRRAGITISHVTEYAVKSSADLDAAAYLFEHAETSAAEAGFAAYRAAVGEEGIAAAYVNSAGSPMHLIQRELMPLDLFFETLCMEPDRVIYCASAIAGYFERMLALVVNSSAELVLLGSNYDASVTYPPFFAQHITPWLRMFADALHSSGKRLLTHTDGENRGLLQCYLDSGIDIADSVCPSPMTSLSLKDVREAFAGRITIMGGVPSVALLEDSMPDRQFDAFLGTFVADLGAGDHLIAGISDTTPPGASLDRLCQVAERIKEIGAAH